MKMAFLVCNDYFTDRAMQLLKDSEIDYFTSWDRAKGKGRATEPHLGSRTFGSTNSVIMVAFATGSTTIQSNDSPAEVRAAMSVPYLGKDGEPTQVTLKSITETSVKEGPEKDSKVQYVLKNEEIVFARKDVVFWSVAEALDPPLVQEVPNRIVSAVR